MYWSLPEWVVSTKSLWDRGGRGDMMHRIAYLSLLALALSASGAYAACPSEEAIAAYLADFVAKRPSKGLGRNLTIHDAACARARLVRDLPQAAGPVVGYKAAFMTPEV